MANPKKKSDNPLQVVKNLGAKKNLAKLPDVSSLTNTALFPTQVKCPTVIENQIVSFLGLEDINKCPTVSKSWFAAFQKDILWKNFAKYHQIPLDPNISIKNQVIKCYYDFGIYDPKSHRIIATRELDEEDCFKVVKNFPETYLLFYCGMGTFSILYNFIGYSGELDSEDVKYQDEKRIFFEKIEQQCVRIFLDTSKFKPEFDRINF